jgi:hypothetical protein
MPSPSKSTAYPRNDREGRSPAAIDTDPRDFLLSRSAESLRTSLTLVTTGRPSTCCCCTTGGTLLELSPDLVAALILCFCSCGLFSSLFLLGRAVHASS